MSNAGPGCLDITALGHLANPLGCFAGVSFVGWTGMIVPVHFGLPGIARKWMNMVLIS